MPNNSDPGPRCQIERPLWIEDGTMCRSESFAPGPTGVSGGLFRPPDSQLVRTLTRKWQCDDDVRSEIARAAKNHLGSLKWREDLDGIVKCSRFVDDVLGEVFNGALGHHLEKPPRI